MKKNLTKVLAIVLCMMLAVPMTTFFASADEAAVWDGSVATEFAGGKGTADDPYQITSGAHLAMMSETINLATEVVDLGGLYFKLMNDIDMNNKPFEPIGGQMDDIYFAGHFDGNGKTISNLNLVTEYSPSFLNVGLFGCVSNAVIRDLTVAGADVVAQSSFNYGVICGKAINSEIIGCTNKTNTYVTVPTMASDTTLYFGGIVGFAVDGTDIINCVNEGEVKATGRHAEPTRSATVGGTIVGRCDNNLGTDEMVFVIKNCLSTGNLVVTGKSWHSYCAGIVGYCHNGWGVSGGDVYSEDYVVIEFENVLMEGDLDLTTVDIGSEADRTRDIQLAGIVCNAPSYLYTFKNVAFNGEIKCIAEGSDPECGGIKTAGICVGGRSKNTHENVTVSGDTFTCTAEELNDDGTIKNALNKKGIYDDACKTGVTDTSLLKASILAEIAKGYEDSYDATLFDVYDPWAGEGEDDPVEPPVDSDSDTDPVEPPVDSDSDTDPVEPPVDSDSDTDPVDPGTDSGKPADSDDEKEEEKGCGGSITMAGIAMVAVLGTAAVVVAKKKED